MPAADASQCVDATMPNVPLSSGRVVNVIGRRPYLTGDAVPAAVGDLVRAARHR
jgi:hypothetical protein